MVQRGASDVGLIAEAHIQDADTLEMNKGSIRNGGLLALTHAQTRDALQMDEGSICNLMAAYHSQGVYSLYMSKGGI